MTLGLKKLNTCLLRGKVIYLTNLVSKMILALRYLNSHTYSYLFKDKVLSFYNFCW